MAYNRFIIPRQKPAQAANFISPAPTFLAKAAGSTKITNPAINPIIEYRIENSGNPFTPKIVGTLWMISAIFYRQH